MEQRIQLPAEQGAIRMIPDYQTLMRPILESAQEGEVRIGEIVDRLADRFDLSEEERNELLPSGRQARFTHHVHWAKSCLNRAGFVRLTRRAYFIITDRGRDALADVGATINNAYLEQFEGYRDAPEIVPNDAVRPDERPRQAYKQINDDLQSKADATPEELMEDSDRQIRDKLADELLENITALSPGQFERLVVNLVEKMGYGKGKQVGGSGDGGIDGIINQDPLGLEKVYIQAKRWSNQIGDPEIRNFSGSLDAQGAAKGVFITNSTFNSRAKRTAENISAGAKFIRLIEGRELAELMIEHSVGVVTKRTYEVKNVDENYFAEND